MRLPIAIASFVLSLVGVSRLAGAQPASDAQKASTAQALFDQAVDEMAVRNFASACPKLEQATRLIPDAVGAKVQLAECYEASGKKASAWSTWNQVTSLATSQHQPDRVKKANERVAVLQPELASLAIRVASDVARIPDLKVTRDGIDIGRAGWSNALPVDVGAHEISVSAPGYTPWKTSVTVARDGVKLSVEVPTLAKLPIAPEKGAAAKPSETPARIWQAPLGIGAMVTGGAALAAGAVVGGVAIAKNSESNQHECDEATNRCTPAGLELRRSALRFGNASTGLLIAGGVVATAGVVVFATAPRARASAAPKAALVVGPSHLVLRGTFP